MHRHRPNENEQITDQHLNKFCIKSCAQHDEYNDLITYLLHLINKKNSTGANICCRPNVNELLHSLKQSLSWPNESTKFDKNCEQFWQLSQKFLDKNMSEW